MTRGKMILINKDKFSDKLTMNITCEFNGDMYISCYGKNVITNLEYINNYVKFRKYVDYFDDMFFKYKEIDDGYYGIDFEYIKGNCINVCDNYFNKWFSDYLYFKNVSGEDVAIKCKKENGTRTEKIIIKNGEIKVFNFGRIVDYKKELKELL